jgi:hypothetical protein
LRFVTSSREAVVVKITILALVLFALPLGRPAAARPQAAIHHPDGRLGRLSGWVSGSYLSPLGETRVPIVDQTRIGLGIRFPATRRFTLEAGYFLSSGDSVFHEYSVAVKAYMGDPLRSSTAVNPDGKIGAPIISVLFHGVLPDRNPGDHHHRVCLRGWLPVSRNMTVAGGWRYYEIEDPFQVDEYFAAVRLFPRDYPAGEEYINPDGVEGIPSLSLTGGGSVNGFHGQLDIIMPLSPRVSIAFLIRGERVASPYLRTAELGGKISFYPNDN